jgi:hypothetical protein
MVLGCRRVRWEVLLGLMSIQVTILLKNSMPDHLVEYADRPAVCADCPGMWLDRPLLYADRPLLYADGPTG